MYVVKKVVIQIASEGKNTLHGYVVTISTIFVVESGRQKPCEALSWGLSPISTPTDIMT
jgi:hypothetical protein